MNRLYWDTVGATKTFTHPVHREWLAGVDRSARVLDYGCGYGRVMAELSDLGFDRVSGADVSAALITRGRRSRPDLSLELITSPPALSHPAESFDVIVLFAVLTCVPDGEAQRALVAELHRLLRAGGLLYVSDLTLQADTRRYTGSPYGVFTTDDGAVCRHHDVDYLRILLTSAGFRLEGERHLEAPTMNGNRATAIQLLARRRSPDIHGVEAA